MVRGNCVDAGLLLDFPLRALSWRLPGFDVPLWQDPVVRRPARPDDQHPDAAVFVALHDTASVSQG